VAFWRGTGQLAAAEFQGGDMSAAVQLRLIIFVFYLFGGLSLLLAAAQLALGLTPRIGPVASGAIDIVAAWQLLRGSVLACFVLAIKSALASVAGIAFAVLIGREFPLILLLMLLGVAISLVCAYLLFFSRPLKAELESRRSLNQEASRAAYQKYLSELDQP
jgi:hypothetical protein